jgi:PAS domain S-box-containing protein
MPGKKNPERQASGKVPDQSIEDLPYPDGVEAPATQAFEPGDAPLVEDGGRPDSMQRLREAFLEKDRTQKSLEQANAALQIEVAERERAQEELQASLQELQTVEEELRLNNDALGESRKKLEEERQRYQDLFEFAPDGYLVTDAFGVILEINQAAANLFGVEPVFLIKKPLMVLIPRRQHRAFSLLLDELRRKGGYKAREFNIRARSEVEIPVALTVIASSKLNGNKRTLRWIMRDISERKRADELIRRANAYNRSLLEASLDPLVTITVDGKIGDVNSATEQVTGKSREELIGTDFSDYFTDPERARRGYQQVFETGFVRDYELEIRNVNGFFTPVFYNATVYRDQAGNVSGAFAAARDISERKRAERALQQANELLERMFDSVDILIAYLDRDFNFIRVNRAYAQSDEKNPDFFPGKNHFDLYPNLENQSIFRKVVETGKPYTTYERPFEYADHPERGITYWDWTLQPVKDVLGKVEGLVLSLNDVTERKRAEIALRESEMRYRSLVETSPDSILLIGNDRRIQFANRQSAVLFGFTSPNALIGLDAGELLAPQDRGKIFRAVDDSDALEGINNLEVTILRRDGTCFPAEISVTLIQGADGKPTGFLGMGRDISERKRAEEVIQEYARRAVLLSEISQAMSEVSLDEKAILDTIARTTASAFGDICIIRLASEDQKWLEAVAFFHTQPDYLALLRESFSSFRHTTTEGIAGQVFQSGQALLLPKINLGNEQVSFSLHLFSHQATAADEDNFGIESLLAVPLRIQGNIIGVMSLYRETGGRPYEAEDQALIQTIADRAAQAIHNARLYHELQSALLHEQAMRAQLVQAEKFAAMGRMLASITHEINNPLQTIKNCLYLGQQENPEDSQTHEFISIAYAETDRLSNLVAQLREVYRPLASVQEKPVVLPNLINDVYILLATQLKDKNVQWKAESEDSGDLKVEGVADQLKQVFLNICLNAVDAMQPTGGNLLVDFTYSEDGRQVGVRIRDTGPGIESDVISRLFEPFYTTKEKGLGLGLSICFDIVQRHKGHIDVESQPGEGAVFTVWLPVLKDEQPHETG